MIWEYDCTALHMVEKVHSCEHRPAVLAKDIWNEMKVVKWSGSCEMKDLEIWGNKKELHVDAVSA